jgi:hypothetical protein
MFFKFWNLNKYEIFQRICKFFLGFPTFLEMPEVWNIRGFMESWNELRSAKTCIQNLDDKWNFVAWETTATVR